jgi:sporulation protein YlmC with PRC-barrel domain
VAAGPELKEASMIKPQVATSQSTCRASAPAVIRPAQLLAGALLLVGATIIIPQAVQSQTVQLVKVDVNVVSKGYRATKLIGSKVTNEKNEKVGSIDDMIIDEKKSIFAVLQVGGFLGLGGYLVAIPYESLVIQDNGKTIKLPGASPDAVRNLGEFKYTS